MGRWRRRAHQQPPVSVGFIGRKTSGATDRLHSLATTVYVVEEAKVLYVQVFKAACSTMLWTIAEMVGYGPADHPLSTDLHVTRSLTIHDVALHPVPTIDAVSPALRHEALTSPDWLRVAVIRDPYSRLYSGWESRVLLLHDGPWSEYPQSELVFEDGLLDLGQSFRSFVASVAEHRSIWQGDFHFAQQVYQLALDEIDFTDLVTTSDLPVLFSRLSERCGRTLNPGRHNEGLGISLDDVYDPATTSLCEELYDQDFARLGFPHRTFSGPRPVVLDAVATAGLRLLDERNKRIEDLVGEIARRQESR